MKITKFFLISLLLCFIQGCASIDDSSGSSSASSDSSSDSSLGGFLTGGTSLIPSDFSHDASQTVHLGRP